MSKAELLSKVEKLVGTDVRITCEKRCKTSGLYTLMIVPGRLMHDYHGEDIPSGYLVDELCGGFDIVAQFWIKDVMSVKDRTIRLRL